MATRNEAVPEPRRMRFPIRINLGDVIRERCLRLQRGGGVRGWGRDGLGTGAPGRGARARRALMSTSRACLRCEASFLLIRAGHLPLDAAVRATMAAGTMCRRRARTSRRSSRRGRPEISARPARPGAPGAGVVVSIEARAVAGAVPVRAAAGAGTEAAGSAAGEAGAAASGAEPGSGGRHAGGCGDDPRPCASGSPARS